MTARTTLLDDNNEETKRCRHCHCFSSLHLDWSAGDIVCTNCGVVHEERVCDDGPEWREFTQDNDLAKGAPSRARCGMVATDESRFLGGLEPTRLSKQAFGGGSYNKRLVRTNRQVDILMVKQNAKALKQAKLSRQVRRLQRSGADTETDFSEREERPDDELQLIQEEQDAKALVAEKWSLERAILLHGTDDEQPQHQINREELREQLMQRLDKQLMAASADLYRAYNLLQVASRKLNLSERVMHEAANMLCRYAVRRNGILVKGVSSRVSVENNCTASNDETRKKETMNRLREFNKVKQMASLGAALVFLTARNLGWARSIDEVCTSFHQPQAGLFAEIAIKPKHCFRAVHQIKAAFPDYARSVAPIVTQHDDTDRFVEHATRKLSLPPVALASIRILVASCRKDQVQLGNKSGTTLSTMCASLAYFVCSAGATMQRLAQQAQQPTPVGTSPRGRTLKRKAMELPRGKKLFKMEPPPNVLKGDTDGLNESPAQTLNDDPLPAVVPSGFDVFSHAPVKHDPAAKAEYEARRIWDAWTEQTPWSRSLSLVEQSCGVSRSAVSEYYKNYIYPRRKELLEMLRDGSSLSAESSASIRDTPLASVLLSNIAAAAPLMSNKWKD